MHAVPRSPVRSPSPRRASPPVFSGPIQDQTVALSPPEAAAEERVPGEAFRALAQLHRRLHPGVSREGLARDLRRRLAAVGVPYHLRTLKRQLTGAVATVPPVVEATLRAMLNLRTEAEARAALAQAGIALPAPRPGRTLAPARELVPLAQLWLDLNPAFSKRSLAARLHERLAAAGHAVSVDYLQGVLGGRRGPGKQVGRPILDALHTLLAEQGVRSPAEATALVTARGQEMQKRADENTLESGERLRTLVLLWQRHERTASTRALAEALRTRLAGAGPAPSLGHVQSVLRPGARRVRRRYRLALEALLREELPGLDPESAAGVAGTREDLAWIPAATVAALARTWRDRHPRHSLRQLAQATAEEIRRAGYVMGASTLQPVLGGWKRRTRGFVLRALRAVVERPAAMPGNSSTSRGEAVTDAAPAPSLPRALVATMKAEETGAATTRDSGGEAKTQPRLVRAAAEAPPDALARYFRELRDLPPLRPHQEFELARDIEAREAAFWRILLDLPAAAGAIVEEIERTGGALPATARYLRAAQALSPRAQTGRGTKEPRPGRGAERTRAAFEGARDALAEAVHERDQDGDHALAIVRRLREGLAQAPAGVPPRSWAAHRTAVLARAAEVRAAKATFFEANLRLVLTVARRLRRESVPLEDLIQDGNLGLMKAVERFDPGLGFRFSTYATWWIRHAINRGIADRGRTVRLPVHVLEALQRVQRARHALGGTLGRDPTVDEVAERAGLDPAEVIALETSAATPLSMDQTLTDEPDGRTRHEIAPDAAPLADDRLAAEERNQRVLSLLPRLSPIEAEVLRKRFGLDDDAERTLEQIGQEHGLSRERIRQIQVEALAKLRALAEETGLAA